jgi:hypothetical protein
MSLRERRCKQQTNNKLMKIYATMEESNGEQYGRPRRPKPETVSYLNGLPLNEIVAIKQVREYVEYYKHKRSSTGSEEEDAPEYPPMVSAAHAALSSIFHEFASLACEELPSQQIETLVRIACRYSLVVKRVILASMAGYWTFLSTHRFGSHVAQTVLRCVVADCEINLDEFDDGQKECEGRMVITDSYASLGEDAVPLTLSVPLLNAINELKQFAPDLAVHVCGSHVLRTSMCVLLGAEFVDAFMPPGSTDNNTNNSSMNDWDTGALAATRRGKVKDKKLKKKKRGSADDEKGNSRHEVTVVKMMKVVPELLTTKFREDAKIAMNEMVDIVTSSDSIGEEIDKMQPPGTIQQLTCHPSAGPLLIQILRLLCFNSSQSSKAKMSRNDEITPNRRLVILPQEPCYTNGSKAEWLLHRLLCWDAKIDASGSDGGESSSKQPYAGDIIYGLSGEPRGSVLLDTIFRCCPDSFHDTLCNIGGFYDEETLREYCQHGVSNFVVQTLLMSVRSKNQVCRMVKCLCGIVEDGSLMKVNRMGVIWRACEMCATKGNSQDQEQLLSALMRGFATTFHQGEKSNDKDVEENTRKRRSKAKGMSVEECIPRLLGLSPGSGVGEHDRLTLNAEGSRALYHILQFKERLRKDWVNGIVETYGRDELSKIANDGLGSTCVIDALLDGPAKSVASKMLHQKLSDRITYLATERVGHHTVEKIFRALPTMEDKALLSAELSHSLNKLGSNAMGRSVMVSCAVKEYCEGESVWKEAVSKQKGKESWLKEIIGEKEASDDDGDEGKKEATKKGQQE